jgi:6-pyruvoyltetrahydropterin/6-carboxytetrahydropterin synthase
MVIVCRKEGFCAAHRLYNPHWTKEKNEATFGPCANEYFHGHNFDLTVKVKGIPSPDSGFVLDMKKLGELIKKEVIARLDHKNLNIEVDFLQGKMPSCEILAMEIWKILAPKIHMISDPRSEAHLYCIELYETAKNYVEYFGE